VDASLPSVRGVGTEVVPRGRDRAPGVTGGVRGNARLTASLGLVLFVLLFLEGVTILRIRQLITWHVFVGLLLIPVVLAKIASTGYRFLRYYRGDAAYVAKGPPTFLLRVTGRW
jgi:hypothetical protein